MDILVIIYMVIVLAGVLVYYFNLSELKAKKKKIGTIQAKWSSKFNISIKLNWVNWAIVIAYLGWSLFLIIVEPHRKNDYISLVLFIIFLSFSPRWTTVIGSQGVISGMEVFLWENLAEWKVISKGKLKYMELKWESRSRPSELKTKLIRLPENKEVILPPSPKERKD